MADNTLQNQQQELLNAVRAHYHQFEVLIQDAHHECTDVFILQRLGEDLEEYVGIVDQVHIILFFVFHS